MGRRRGVRRACRAARRPSFAALLADAAHGAGQVEEAAAYAAEAVALAERTGTPADRCQALVAQARVARLHDLAASGAGFGRAAQLAAEHGLAAWRVEALHGLGSLEALESESTATLETARAVAADVGLLGQVTGLDMMIGEHLLLVGGPPAARDLAEELVERGVALRMPAGRARRPVRPRPGTGPGRPPRRAREPASVAGRRRTPARRAPSCARAREPLPPSPSAT